MSNAFEIGKKIGQALKQQRPGQSVPSIAINIDPEPVAKAIGSAVEAVGDRQSSALNVALEAALVEVTQQMSEQSEAVHKAVRSLAAEVKAHGARDTAGPLVKALGGYGEAVMKQAQGLSELASAIADLAKAQRADKIVEYDTQGRIVRVKVN